MRLSKLLFVAPLLIVPIGGARASSVVATPNAGDFQISLWGNQYTVTNNSTGWYIFDFSVSNPAAFTGTPSTTMPDWYAVTGFSNYGDRPSPFVAYSHLSSAAAPLSGDIGPGQRSNQFFSSSTAPGYGYQIQVVDASGRGNAVNVISAPQSSDGAFHFNLTVGAGQSYSIDPSAATGYIYRIGAGDPSFATVELPNIGNSHPYSLYLWNGTTWVFNTTLAANTPFSFGPAGVDRFEVLGIDPSLGLDPSNLTAFVTSLSFTGNGSFTGTMTPIASDVPEPSTWAMMLIGFAGLGYLSFSGRTRMNLI